MLLYVTNGRLPAFARPTPPARTQGVVILYFVRPVLLLLGALLSSLYYVRFAWWLDDWTFKGRQARFEREIQKDYSWLFEKYGARLVPTGERHFDAFPYRLQS